MGRRTQQRRRKRVEELIALRHDEREFRRRWMARVEAWCKGLAEGRPGSGQMGPQPARERSSEVKPGGSSLNGLRPGDRAAEIIESVLRELADIGEPVDSPLAVETRARLEAASGRAAATPERDQAGDTSSGKSHVPSQL